MNNNKLLIIGKNSFLGENLYKGVKNKINTCLISYEQFCKLNNKKLFFPIISSLLLFI